MLNKIAQIPWSKILQGAGATAAGGAIGYGVMPHLTGYQDVENACRAGGFINAMNGLALFLAAKKFGGIKGLAALAAQHPGKLSMLGAGEVGMELAPNLIAGTHRISEAPVAIAGAMKDIAAKPNMPQAIGSALSTPIARGVGGGIGVAGAGGLLTGLLRRQSEDEERKGTSRPVMIAKDTLKYLIPAMVAGGVIGSMKQKSQSTPPIK